MFAQYDKTTGIFEIQGNELNITEAEDVLNVSLGEYTDFIYDKKKKTLEVKEDAIGGKKWTYMLDEGRRIYLSSSLRVLKERLNKNFQLNEGMLPHFMYNGFLYGKHTLVCGVFKLEPGTSLFFDREKIRKQVLSTSYKEVEEEKYGERYEEYLNLAVRKSVENQLILDGKINLTLSAGYDSNCILHFIRKYKPDIPVRCFSIGGYKGVDETENAEKISELYENICFRKKMVTPDTLEKMEEIVERLEGCVYERGIFLQYELARLLKEEKCKNIICGECADQIFNKNFYELLPEDNFLFDYEHHPRQMCAYVVKKKNELMLNSFGIEVQYPFLDKNVRNLAYFMRKKNGTKKVFHIEKCKEWFSENVLSYIEKQGGSTNLDALFENGADISGMMRRNPFYSEEFRITQKYPRKEAERDYYLTLKYVELFKKIFCD
ncbi:MAG: asparagine synthase-related protein [Schaedlerella sp.]|nr:asparagine synthase-related protein [Schaedlerella sp.]